jgi:hypothetical protein
MQKEVKRPRLPENKQQNLRQLIWLKEKDRRINFLLM